ncbi:MAG: hypothetical protein K0S55_532, partial [Clostridia bacterium]|nr:hypothetical protein [Clostridia bacterium]
MIDKLVYKYIFLAITLLCAVLSMIIPFLFIPFAIIGSTFFAAVVVTNKGPIPILFTAVLFGAALLITGSVTSGFLILFTFLPIGVALGISVMKKLNLNGSTALSTVVSALFFLIIIIFFIFEFSTSFSAKEAFAPIVESVKQVISESYDFIASGISNTDIVVSKETYLDSTYTQLIYSLPYYITAVLFLIVIFSFWLLKFILKGLSINVSHMGA